MATKDMSEVQLLAEVKAAQAEIKRDLAEIRTLLLGNGQEGLLPRVCRLEATLPPKIWRVPIHWIVIILLVLALIYQAGVGEKMAADLRETVPVVRAGGGGNGGGGP